MDPCDRFHPSFYDSDTQYDLVPGDPGEPPKFVISTTPGALSQNINLVKLGDHAYLDDDLDTVTIPDRHLELIMLYVRWAAFQELATTESSDPDPTSLALSTLKLNAFRAQRLYLQSLEKSKQAESKSTVFGWTMDKWERSY